ncbi:hypothetical protein [Streptomyces sp. NPDC015242]|uniref:hypothetical protein n=1 Tax=Streptomyces sp. NPDC015242 TaxID=3364951 RepID=UPI0036FE23CC
MVELARRVSDRPPEAERSADDPEAPWSAGFLHLDLPAQQPSPYAMLRHLIRRVLVVIDYAESRQSQIEQLLAARTHRQAHPVGYVRPGLCNAWGCTR